ncbi:hypothetical protein [Streptomyces sp. NPDC001388]|uniref:hypothetical protein n=1 Tax=Streptomyces sp. NPDC001388 TaxID=3364568 RepID=UPI0036BB0507
MAEEDNFKTWMTPPISIRRTRRVDMPNEQVHFPPVLNGMDYLVSVVENLAEGEEGVPSPRGLKYAVLHLQAASEVLIKARLVYEHWSLVFKDPGRASRQRYEEGDFVSCELGDALSRLRDIAGITIHEKDKKALDTLTRSRNALQHYGLTIPARAVAARSAQVLDFLLRFIHEQLRPQLADAEQKALDDEMEHVRDGLWDITSFLNMRLRRLQTELENLQDRTIECSECAEYAVVIGNEDSVSCRFCHAMWPDKATVMSEYADHHESVQMSFGDFIGLQCPNCQQVDLLMDSVKTAVECGPGFVMCFGCGSTWRHLQRCSSCPSVFDPDSAHESNLCLECAATAQVTADRGEGPGEVVA